MAVFVAPLVFRAPEGPAAREAWRPHFALRRASKPARALRALRRPPHRRRCVAVRRLGASPRCPARPRHRLCGCEMGVFGAVFGRRGDAGFSVPLLGVSSGVVGFNVPTLSRLMREKLRPARSDVCVSAKKFALHAQNTPKSAFLRVLGEFFRGRVAGGAVLGEFFRANRPCAGLGCSAAHFRLAAVGGFAALEAGCRRVAGVSMF